MDFPVIDPVLFEFGPFPGFGPFEQIGPFAIRWYALAYLAGFILGWRYALHLVKRDPENKPHGENIDDFFLWAMIGVIFGGRLGYVLFYNLAYYMDHPSQIMMVWNGGMSFHGGMLGVMFAMFSYSILKGVSFLRLSDVVCCVVPIGLFFGRIANFINGELFGRVTNVPWGIVFPHGGEEPRHPSQLYEAGLEGLVLFIVMLCLIRMKWLEKYVGGLTGIFLMGYGLSRFAVEYVREPDEQLGLIGDVISMGQILSLPMILIGGVLIYMARQCIFIKEQSYAG